jgi:hypothetical protein
VHLRVWLRLACAAVAVVAVAACSVWGVEPAPAPVQPRDGRSGLSLTGTVSGRQVAVSAGAPQLLLEDCDVNTGVDVDLCFFASDIDGSTFGLVFENPAVLQSGRRLDVVVADCSLDGCDGVDDGVVVDVQFGAGQDRVRAVSGAVTVDVVEAHERYAGSIELRLPEGRLTGTFDVVPRPESS